MDRKHSFVIICALAALLTGCGGGQIGPTPLQPVTIKQPAPAPDPTPAPAAPTSPTSAAPAPAAPSSPLPAVPASAKVFDHLQDTTDTWESCSPCAGGTNVTTNYWTAPFQSTPSMSGSSREFFIGGPPWSNVLWYKKLPPDNSATHFLWDFWVYFDPTSAAEAWTAEYDLWQSIGGREFMIGSQCNFGDGHWDTFDSKNNKWMPTTISCKPFTPNAWHHIQWYVERTSDTQYRYNTLVLDDQAYTLNQTFEVNPIDWVDSMGVQWQLDQNANGTPLHEWIDNVKLSIW
jgi:hypothetical protein